MKKGVIYARYSSERQNEQSIAGQVDVCKKWARDNDISVVQIYRDEALTGKTDKRPDFQRMIKDAKNGKFEYIIVYKLDRFARNRYDSAIYKAQLKKYGIRVLSAMENLTDGPESIILESMLEGMAEYFSANLSQNVTRGMRQNAEQGKYVGGGVPLGYKIDSELRYVIDENTAPIVKRIYEMYANGHTMKDICTVLNEAGYKTSQGKKFGYNSLYSILHNPKYIGVYEYMDIVVEGVVPAIISMDLWESAQKRNTKNKQSPASAKTTVDFRLTGKLFCGKCLKNMSGDSGKGRSGESYYYYSCVSKKRKKGCDKKSVQKDWIEGLVTDITVKEVLTDENIAFVAQRAYELYEKERNDTSEITALKNSLREVQKTIDNLMQAIEQGIITDTTKDRMFEAEERKQSLQMAIAKEEIKKPPITAEQIEFFLYEMKSRVYNSEEMTTAIIDSFVNAVYLYDDKIIITYNFKDGEGQKKLELTDLERFGFSGPRCTITILSELLMFAIVSEIRSV